ncbi:MAG TPA: N-acetylmuramoyl-L-alanine amidase [Actinocatenispora sp.]
MTGIQGGFSRRGVLRAGVGTAAAGLGLTALGGTASAADATGAAGAAGAEAAKIPWIIDTASWGARPVPDSDLTILHGTTRKIVVHHMAFPNVTDYSEDHAKQLARDCQDLHMDGNGWADTGQHFTVSRGGYVLEGRHESLPSLELGTQQVQGAHCVGENTQSIGIENEGTYVTETPPPALLASLVRLCTTICTRYGIHAWNMFGHWDWNNTDCPGIMFYREFPKLRLAVARACHERLRSVPARTWPDIFTSSAGSTVTTLQYLLAAQGYAVTPNAGFDAATKAGVQDFQAKHGFEVASDGTVTQPTWEALAPRLDRRATGDVVKAAQSILAHKGYEVTVTGEYDADTTRAVRAMQRLHHLPATGVTDTTTWCAILGGIVRAEFLGLPF